MRRASDGLEEFRDEVLQILPEAVSLERADQTTVRADLQGHNQDMKMMGKVGQQRTRGTGTALYSR